MAYTGKYIAIERIIENAFRKTNGEEIDWEAAIEWSVSLMRILGVPSIFIDKFTNGKDNNPFFIEIADYRGIIPNDIIKINGLRRVILNSDYEVIRYYPLVATQELFFDTIRDVDTVAPVVSEPYFKTVEIDSSGEAVPIEVTQEFSYPSTNVTFSYKLNNNIIFTDFKEGYIEMAYKGLSLDERGVPMIPDDEKLINALMWEIIANIDWINWRKNPSPQNASIKNDSEQKRDWYVGQAQSKARIPSIDELEGIKNAWLRSIQDVNAHKTNFQSNNYPEIRYTQNNKR